MWNDPAQFFVLFVLVISLMIFIGVYLMFFKRKVKSNVPSTAWLDNLDLSASAKSVHLKEFNKQTEKKFTLKWFLEYWRGQRSAFYAWFTWVLLGGIVIKLILLTSSFLLPMQESLFSMLSLLLIVTYTIFAAIILWKCARNSARFYKYFARLVAMLSVFGLITKILTPI